jgi:hypothetical protein
MNQKMNLSRTIKAIERHTIPRSTSSPVRLGLQPHDPKLVAEWQHGAEILGHAQQKLRLSFAQAQFSVGTC